uniref:Lipoprotein n=1 Tax=Proteus mirabilis TaxID=584 RepID=A0A5P2YBW4_PROMI|nr:hypothetical protein [Proteus mirabilis]QXV89122.1 hypothetical protein [Proteus mirabilis]
MGSPWRLFFPLLLALAACCAELDFCMSNLYPHGFLMRVET